MPTTTARTTAATRPTVLTEGRARRALRAAWTAASRAAARGAALRMSSQAVVSARSVLCWVGAMVIGARRRGASGATGFAGIVGAGMGRLAGLVGTGAGWRVGIAEG